MAGEGSTVFPTFLDPPFSRISVASVFPCVDFWGKLWYTNDVPFSDGAFDFFDKVRNSHEGSYPV